MRSQPEREIRRRYFKYGATVAVLAASYKMTEARIAEILARAAIHRRHGKRRIRKAREVPAPTFSLPFAPVVVQLERTPSRKPRSLPYRKTDANGYIVITHGAGYQEREHRLVMAAILGRPLERDEHVHHRNEVTHDNNPANLMLVSPLEHRRIHALAAKD